MALSRTPVPHPPHLALPDGPTDSPLPFKLRRRQFPVRLAFATTINKSQAQTLSRVDLYYLPDRASVMDSCTLPSPAAGSQQMTAMEFVAYRRWSNARPVRDFHFHTLQLPYHQITPTQHVYTRNVVYREVLNAGLGASAHRGGHSIIEQCDNDVRGQRCGTSCGHETGRVVIVVINHGYCNIAILYLNLNLNLKINSTL